MCREIQRKFQNTHTEGARQRCAQQMAAKKTAIKTRPVVVCTSHRGVFYGHASDTTGDVVHLKGARMAIYWGTDRGVMQLAETGPTPKSKVSAKADIEVRSITAVLEVSDAAEVVWQAVK